MGGVLATTKSWSTPTLKKKSQTFFLQIRFFATYMQNRHKKQQSCKIWGLYSKNWLRYGHFYPIGSIGLIFTLITQIGPLGGVMAFFTIRIRVVVVNTFP